MADLKTRPHTNIDGKMNLWDIHFFNGACSLVRRFCSSKVRKSEIKGASFRRHSLHRIHFVCKSNRNNGGVFSAKVAISFDFEHQMAALVKVERN